jgi:hypothetical protein
VAFHKTLHGEKFRTEFKPSSGLTDEQNAQIAALIKKYWCVFDDNGLFIPVHDTNVRSTQVMRPQSLSRKSTMGPMKHQSCGMSLSLKSMTEVDGCSKPSSLPNPIRSMSLHCIPIIP